MGPSPNSIIVQAVKTQDLSSHVRNYGPRELTACILEIPHDHFGLAFQHKTTVSFSKIIDCKNNTDELPSGGGGTQTDPKL